MATLPVPDTWSVGDKITAAKLGNISAALNFLLNQPRATVYQGGNASIANNTATVIGFGVEDEDTDNMHSNVTNASRLVINTTGAYLVTGIARFASGTGWCAIDIRKNAAGAAGGGTSVLANDASLATVTGNGMTVVRRVPSLLSSGDYLEMFVTQTSGAAINLLGGAVNLASFGAAWVGSS